jgi:hypothetical protein
MRNDAQGQHEKNFVHTLTLSHLGFVPRTGQIQTMMLRLLLMGCLLCMPAFAAGLLPSSDAPLRSARFITEATDAVGGSTSTVTLGDHFARTLLAGIFSSTAGVLTSVAVGALSNSLLGAALPVLLIQLLLPPVLTTLAALFFGNFRDPGRFSFWLPALGTFLLHGALFVVTSLAFVLPWSNPISLLAYTVIDGVLMSGSSVGLMHLFQRSAASKVSTLRSFVPGVTDTNVVSLWRTDL